MYRNFAGIYLVGFEDIAFSLLSVLAERGHVHDAAVGDAVLNTPPGRVEAKMQQATPFSVTTRLFSVCQIDIMRTMFVDGNW